MACVQVDWKERWIKMPTYRMTCIDCGTQWDGEYGSTCPNPNCGSDDTEIGGVVHEKKEEKEEKDE